MLKRHNPTVSGLNPTQIFSVRQCMNDLKTATLNLGMAVTDRTPGSEISVPCD